MTREFGIATTALTVSAIWAVDHVLDSSEGPAFVSINRQQQPQRSAAAAWTQTATPQQPAALPALGSSGLLAYGVGCGALAAVACSGRSRRTRRAAADIEVAEKTETKPVSYLETIPRSIIERKTLDKLLSTVPKEQWENPPEDSYLYTLKAYAETYGPGKATKMGWYDFWYMRINAVDEDEFYSGEELKQQEAEFREVLEGKIPMLVPGPAGLFWTGATIQWRGPEMFAGDQLQTPVNSGLFAKQYINNLAFYRDGLQPWQRGLEIGMAHGYFLIGPFVSLGPLRNTPEAATVGLLCGCAVVGIVSVGGLIFGSTIKPTRFDKEGQADGAGFIEMINWHAVGGIGGAGFAHALITVFGS